MPNVVIAFTNRSWRRLVQHVFAIAGWSTEVTHSSIDTLAMAFNSDADMIVTANDAMGIELLSDLEKDTELSSTPCAMILFSGEPMPDTAYDLLTLYPQPCDPYWIVEYANRRLGRETSAGLGCQTTSETHDDHVLHEWWWSLTASHLVQHILTHVEAGMAPHTIRDTIRELLEQRVGVAIRVGDAIGNGEKTWLIADKPLPTHINACIDAVEHALNACAWTRS